MEGYAVLGYVELGLLVLATVTLVFAIRRYPDRSQEAHGMRNDESLEAASRRGEIARQKQRRVGLQGTAGFLAFCALVLMVVQAAQSQ